MDIGVQTFRVKNNTKSLILTFLLSTTGASRPLEAVRGAVSQAWWRCCFPSSVCNGWVHFSTQVCWVFFGVCVCVYVCVCVSITRNHTWLSRKLSGDVAFQAQFITDRLISSHKRGRCFLSACLCDTRNLPLKLGGGVAFQALMDMRSCQRTCALYLESIILIRFGKLWILRRKRKRRARKGKK